MAPRAGTNISIFLCAKPLALEDMFTHCSLAALAGKDIAWPNTKPTCVHFSKMRRFPSKVWPHRIGCEVGLDFYELLFTRRTSCTRFPAQKKADQLAKLKYSSIWTKLKRYFSLVLDISMFKRPFHSILHAERGAYGFQRQNQPRNSQIAIIRRIYEINTLYLARLRYFDASPPFSLHCTCRK